MTDYKGAKGSSTPSWKRQESGRKWQKVIAILLCLVFFFAAVNGVIKSAFAFASFSKGEWDGQSTFSIAFDTKPASVFVFQKDPKRIAIITAPIDGEGKQLQENLSRFMGAKINNFIDLSGEQDFNQAKQKEILDNLTSITTPLKILVFGPGEEVHDTNITRIDAIRLWWQIKGLSVNNLNLVDLGGLNERLKHSDEKVLGAYSEAVSRQVSPYFTNQKIIEENIDIVIVDSTGSDEVAINANRFIESAGGKVVSTTTAPAVSGCTVSSDEDSYTASYLANLFDCDIKGAQNERKSSKVTIILGIDFSK